MSPAYISCGTATYRSAGRPKLAGTTPPPPPPQFRRAAQGFQKLRNVTGGIDAYSREVDSSVPLY